MKMKLGLEEDTNLEGTESVDPIEEASADQEANEAVEEATEEVEEVVDMGMNICEVIDNLTSLRAHVKKFGVTKQMLHLVNANNQLGDAIGITLPYYESDDEADDINEDEIPSEEVVMEGFSSGMKKAKDAIVRFFKKIWEATKNFTASIFTAKGRLKRKFEGAVTKITNDKADTEKMKSVEANIVSFSDFKTKLENIDTALSALFEAEKTMGSSPSVAIDNVNKGLIWCGKAISEHDGKYEIRSTSAPKTEKKSLQDLGWGMNNLSSTKNDIKSRIADSSASRSVEKLIKKSETEAIKAAQTKTDAFSGSKEGKVDKDTKTSITNLTSVIISAFRALNVEEMKCINTWINVAYKIPVAKEADKK